MDESKSRLQTCVNGVLNRFLDVFRCLVRREGLGSLDEDVTQVIQPEGVHLLGGIVERSAFEILVDLPGSLAEFVQNPALCQCLLAGLLQTKGVYLATGQI